MLEDDFAKERQNIREKMLQFSRAISQGKALDENLKEMLSSDDILRRRFKKKTTDWFLEDFNEEYNLKQSKQSHIYLKEDLINVKLEERQTLAKKILSKIKAKKKEDNLKSKKIFSFLRKKSNNIKNTPIKVQNQIKNNAAPIQKKKQIVKTPNNEIYEIESKIEKSQPFQKISFKNQINIEQSLDNLHKKITQEENKKKLFQVQIKIPKKEYDEDTQKIKNSLLEGFFDATKEDKNLNFNHLLFAILTVSFALFLFVPQIYIRNQIYYLSREIGALRTQESVLNEENKELKRRLENMRFQNQILDYLE